ncbi:uncharacterized protein LOC141569996 [Rhinolophus sinicus]|uniref:uncharacterized protein LOC141569996 n=1 Tax=Rhinolophus sinicus TaxID=89399 RepID=UPI003D7A2C77
MKTLAPAARVWSPAAPHAEAAGVGVAASGLGIRALQARHSPKVAPSTRRAPASVRQTIWPSVRLPASGKRGRSRCCWRHYSPACWLARARPPLAPPAARSTRSPGSSSAGRLQLRLPPEPRCVPRARTGSGAPGWPWHHVAAPPPPSTFSAPPAPFLPAPSLAAWSANDPPARQRGSSEGQRAEGRREGARENADWKQVGGVTAIDEQRVRSLSASRTNRQLLEGHWGKGRSGARGLGYVAREGTELLRRRGKGS